METLSDKIRQIDHVLKVGDLAPILAVSEDSLYRLVQMNRIPYFTIGKSIRFDPEIIAAWLEKKTLIGKSNGKRYWYIEG
jgi:excisionase family DNA binding protein